MNEFLTCDIVEFEGSGGGDGSRPEGLWGFNPSRITPNSPEMPAEKPRGRTFGPPQQRTQTEVECSGGYGKRQDWGRHNKNTNTLFYAFVKLFCVQHGRRTPPSPRPIPLGTLLCGTGVSTASKKCQFSTMPHDGMCVALTELQAVCGVLCDPVLCQDG